MTLKELSQLYYLNREIEMDKQRLLELEARALPGAQTLTGMPHAQGAVDRVGACAAEIADLRGIIEAKHQQCLYERNRLERYISGIDDSFLRQIFTYRFVNGLPWAQVAACVGGGNTKDNGRVNSLGKIKIFGLLRYALYNTSLDFTSKITLCIRNARRWSMVAEKKQKPVRLEAMPEWCGADVIAALIGKSVRRVQQLTQEGIISTEPMPGSKLRRYRLVPTVQAYMTYLEDKSGAHGDSGKRKQDLEMQKLEAEVALKESQSELHQMKTEVASGKLDIFVFSPGVVLQTPPIPAEEQNSNFPPWRTDV